MRTRHLLPLVLLWIAGCRSAPRPTPVVAPPPPEPQIALSAAPPIAIETMAVGAAKSPQLDSNLKKVNLSAKEKQQVKAFLESLTGTSSFTGPP